MQEELERRIAALSAHQRALFDARRARIPQGARPRLDTSQEQAPQTEAGDSQTALASSSSSDSRQMQFGLFFFSDDDGRTGRGKYDMLLECARYADRNGFCAVWTPERHFQSFGGLYPNPSVLGAAIAALTERVEIRAGSVVVPLHDPIRIAEEWSVVDNLSGGRAGVAVASGWHADDFVLAPNGYEDRRGSALGAISTIQQLWRGECVTRPNGNGMPTPVRIYPSPVQPQLPMWITATSERSFLEAGRLGVNVLTSLVGHDLSECARRIATYRRVLAENGFDAAGGKVALMLHTYIADETSVVMETVRGPIRKYLDSFIRTAERQLRSGEDLPASEGDDQARSRAAVLDHAFSRHVNSWSLLGTVESCRERVQELRQAGVDELACLVDFGLDAPTVLAGLRNLNALRMQTA